jgi:hypothetical protein
MESFEHVGYVSELSVDMKLNREKWRGLLVAAQVLQEPLN